MTRPSLESMVRALVAPSTQATKMPDGTVVHKVSCPSLLDQLSSREPSSGEGVRRGFGSRPAAAIEAIDMARTINNEARAWAKTLGISSSGKPATVVLRLHGASAQMDRETLADFTITVRRWWVGARILSGWDSAPFKPRNHCPICGELGTLRIVVTDRLAHCVDCKSGWDSATLGVLAEHIRAENGEAA